MTRRLAVRVGAMAALAWSLVMGGEAGAQGYGPGMSPGRAAYRPEAQWNNGPFYTAPHWNPYAAHPSRDNMLVESLPTLPPYGSAPHGLWSSFTPGRGALYPYAEGFSPYSGYARWYEQAYRFQPTRDDIVRSRVMFFRSAPVPPPGVLPPLPPQSVTTAAVPTQAPRPGATAPVRVLTPGRPVGLQPAPSIPVYRSSVAGAR